MDEPAGPLRVWVERAALALASAGAGLLVARWAGTSWTTAAAIAGILLVVVPAAAWAAASVPGPDDPEN
ncbi:MAG: hypothetical protein KJ548_11310 [Actinobacteria bacterium]|nr:hypothetical protein [Actinomycetota bacterium]MBU4337151.1 hypothetical protein [Actinomycetota bacterium]MCG2797234.1 hypothetical protein [Cellulomonas sp.]